MKHKKRRTKRSPSKILTLKAAIVLSLIIGIALIFTLFPGAWELLSKYLPFVEPPRKVTVPNGDIAVHFLDVGQGDCSLIKTPEGKTMLIDASTKDQAAEILEYITSYGVTRIDYFVLTHPHADHIGSAQKIVETLDVGTVIMPDVTTDTATFENLLNAIDKKNIKLHIAKFGDEIKLGQALATVLGPIKKTDDLNNMSIVLRLDYGKTSFLFTGDAEKPLEEDMLDKFGKNAFKADVIKIGHHGAETSSSEEFIRAVSPDYAVISCGKDNSYGHPHAETIETLEAHGIKYFRTDKVGNIIFSSDGEKIALLRPSA